jgi:zinc protease
MDARAYDDAADRIEYAQETLPNGLRVIYAPLRQAPVVHVRVLYHVGSRDERPDRQGFAHMFEHMMFRGSAHVRPEQHMKMVQTVGGMSNAFTSFDQTVYVNTVPSNHLEMALFLEADRMASFKVSAEIFDIERKVVAEEWRRRQNQPYGTVMDEYLRTAYRRHPYRWTPIGNMDHLRAAKAEELQAFFNTYYVPDNAILVVAGDIDVAAAKAMVRRYFGWIPRGEAFDRGIPAEPEQTEIRRKELPQAVRLDRVTVGWRPPPYRSDDHYALTLLASVLGRGESSRLDRTLVHGAIPLCVSAFASDAALEDGGYFILVGSVLQGADADQVETALLAIAQDVIDHGVTVEELDKAKLMERVDFVRNRETADKLAAQLGHEALFGGDAERVNTTVAKMQAVTPADVQAVARKYLRRELATVLRVKAAPPGDESLTQKPEAALVEASSPPRARSPRVVEFPPDYPTEPPTADARLRATFAKGTESKVAPATVIVMPDARLPFVTWSVTMRNGSHAEPVGKEGLAGLTADLVRRGAGGLTFAQLNEDLESRGIQLHVDDGGDYTRLVGSCLIEQLDHALRRTREVLREPSLSAEEFEKLKQQRTSELAMSLSRPEVAASIELSKALFGQSPLGRSQTPQSVRSITLDDVKAFYQQAYQPTDAIVVIAGDVTVPRGEALAQRLLESWQPAHRPRVAYEFPAPQERLRVIVIDRPEGKQAMIRMAARGYSIAADEKFAGSLASAILSTGIDSRLGRHVRAERGLVYSVSGQFHPNRHAGQFFAGAETDVTTAADCVEAMFKVFAELSADGATPKELRDAQLRAVGGMVMQMQTIQQQAQYRVDGLLNGYPIDYYDRYPDRIGEVPLPAVGEVMRRYVRPVRMTVVVVAPAGAVVDQLRRLGEVEVVPMPGKSHG